MGTEEIKKKARAKKKKRIRKKLYGISNRPRLSVFRSAKHIYTQLIDDENGKTLTCASTVEKDLINNDKLKTKVEKAKYVGETIAKRAIDLGIKKIVFDRGGFLYHGRVKAVSDGAREVGLVF